jgi:hypothetical protein
MNIPWTARLFAWDALEDSPSLRTAREFVASVPDGRLLESLRRFRGRGRDDYPVETLWGVLLLVIGLRHSTIESCLAELRRNEGLRRVIGIDSEDKVPNKWNMSRFLRVLGQEPHWSLLCEITQQMVKTLASEVKDLGVEMAGDASWLSARSDHVGKRSRRNNGLPKPSSGRKEYTDEQGNVVRVIEWFGYKLHAVVDKRHEVVLGWSITGADVADNQELPNVLEQAQQNLPKDRIKSLAYDKAADDQEIHAVLDESKIAAVIENRSLWKEEFERMLPGATGRSNIVYDESGTVYCYDKESDPPVRHQMAYIGNEPSRGTLKYRCPAVHRGRKCPSHQRCNAGRNYGLTVRVKREIDLRRFPMVPRATKKFERLYKGRTAVERVIGRLKVFWGADDGNITGPERFHAYVAVVMVVHLAFATILAAAPRREGTLGKMHLGAIAKALREKLRL